MQAAIAEAAVRGQADPGRVSVDSTTARAHHHAAGMVVDPELLEALEEAAEEEKGLRARDKQLSSAARQGTGPGPNAGEGARPTT